MRIEGSIEFSIIEQQPERVISEMPVQAGILNPYGVVHAGADIVIHLDGGLPVA